MVYGLIAMGSLMGFCSLAVDFGRVQVAKFELQRAADAAARAAAASLPNGISSAQAAAISFALNNSVDDSSFSLLSSDIEFGTWDTAAKSFTILTGSSQSTANAIRITAHKSASRGTAVPLLFGKTIGMATCDVKAVSIASINTASSGYGFAGLSSVTISGHSDSDSYNSTSGVYGGSNILSNGDIASNGSITMTGNVNIHGDANPGVGKSISLAKNCVVSGSTAPLSTAISYPPVDASPYASSNNDASIPAQFITNGSFKLNSHDALTIPTGTYYFNDFVVSGNADLTVSGQVTVYVTGDFTMNGHTDTNSNRPTNFKIRVAGSGDVKVAGNADLYADIYAPQSDVKVSSQSDMYGAAVGNTLVVSGNGSLHYDESLSTNGSAATPLVTTVK